MRRLIVSLLAVAMCGSLLAGPSQATSGRALFGLLPGISVRVPSAVQEAAAAAGIDLAGQNHLPAETLSYIPAMNAWQGKNSPVINIFTGVGQTFNAQLFGELFEIWHGLGAVPMISFGTGEFTPEEISGGLIDPVLKAFGYFLKAFLAGPNGLYAVGADDRRIYLRLDWEANGQTYPWSPCHAEFPAADFVEMWQHIHHMYVDELGLDNFHLAWVWNVSRRIVTCTNWQPNGVSDLYPGDTFVDWVSVDGYNNNFENEAAQSPSEVFGPQISNIRAFTSKPMGIAEVGCYSTNEDKATWISNLFSYVHANDVRMLLWFNADNERGDWAVFAGSRGDSSYPVGGPVFHAWSTYADAVASSSWLVTTHDTRLLTNAEFLGNF